jgi:trimeric autotransporter adhesin
LFLRVLSVEHTLTILKEMSLFCICNLCILLENLNLMKKVTPAESCFKTAYLAFALMLFINGAYSQTFFGVSNAPSDNVAQPGATVTLVPPALMQAGDLVIVYGQHRGNGATLSIGTTGGQIWNSGAMYTPGGTIQTIFISWCRYNGIWAANPTVTGGNVGTALTAVMYVFRPSNSNSTWAVHLAQANANGNGLIQSITGVTTTVPRTVSMAFWSNNAQNTWVSSGAAPINVGWTFPVFAVAANQIRNTQGGGGSGQSHKSAYNIQANAATLNNVQQTQSANITTLRSTMTWHEINNDPCAAITLTPGATCVNTPGTLNNATISSGLPAACTSGNLYDVWYQFTATSTSHTIQLSNYGSNFTRRQLVVYQGGNCSGLVYASCTPVQTSGTSLSHTFTDFTPGTVYYIRVIYQTPSGSVLTSNAGFNICVITNTVTTNPVVFTGKSYTNITRPSGGVIRNGDVLEFRANITVGDWGPGQNAPIYNVTYHDTIPAGLSYVPNSIRFETNEGLQYQSGITGAVALTDASGDDEAVHSGGVLRVNVATLNREAAAASPGTNRQFVYQCSPAVTPITYASAGGGKIHPYGRPNQFGGYAIIVVRYQATVIAANGTTFNTSNGAFRYKPLTSSTDDIAFPQTIVNFPRYTVYTSSDTTLCQSSVGINTYSGGDFGTGTTRHDSTQLTIAPGYTWSPFNTGSPGDGFFAVVNNTSADGSTNKFGPSSSRVFTVWDIIGDHTNAINADSGNLAVAPGTNGGYTAVVNAAYGINTAVQKNITGLCSDTYYEFSAWFKNICSACSSDSAGLGNWAGASFKPYIPLGSRVLNDSAGVGPDLTFNIDGQDYYTTGNIPYDKRWVKKGFLFKTGPAQTSVTLTIRNNAPGGGGNDWAIDDIGLATCLPSLTMRPSTTPSYCLNNQITLSVAVSTFYNNYIYYQWERSTDGGFSWLPVPEMPAIQTYSYTSFGSEYRDTVALPSFLATPAINGYRYRIRTATSLSNLSSPTCAVYNTVDVITVGVNTACNVLPAEIISFNAQLKNGYSELKWQVNQEQNLQQYDVERSIDGKNFIKIGSVAARGGVESQSYQFNDVEAVTGKVFYRIKLVANSNNAYKYSNILSVSVSNAGLFELSNLVNPFNIKINFQVTVPQNETIDAELMDASGRPVFKTKLKVYKGTNSVGFEVPAHLQKGNYLLRVVSGFGIVNKLIQKQ